LPGPASAPPAGAVQGAPRRWLRAEGVAALLLAVLLFHAGGHSWLLFAVLFLAPDLGLLAYLVGPRPGAVAYNALHSYAGPLIWGGSALWWGLSPAVPLVWAAHIGFDRALGYGLKYPTAFGHTHLGWIGRAPRPE
jgi:hypothetical protein